MSDNIFGRIDDLVNEEHTLRAKATGSGLTDDDKSRLTELEHQLDQCWDLLRQRRAKVEFPEAAQDSAVRPSGEVESYLQ